MYLYNVSSTNSELGFPWKQCVYGGSKLQNLINVSKF